MKRTGNTPGRPSRFTFEATRRIIARIANGEGISPAARAEHVDPRTFIGWCERMPELQAEFERARAILAFMREDEAWTLAEHGGRGAENEVRWRLEFADRWLPRHVRPR